jgi:cytoskeletal protein RodZ
MQNKYLGLPLWAWLTVGVGFVGYLWWRNRQAAASSTSGSTETVQATPIPSYTGISGSDLASILQDLMTQTPPTGLPQSTLTPVTTPVTTTTTPIAPTSTTTPLTLQQAAAGAVANASYYPNSTVQFAIFQLAQGAAPNAVPDFGQAKQFLATQYPGQTIVLPAQTTFTTAPST